MKSHFAIVTAVKAKLYAIWKKNKILKKTRCIRAIVSSSGTYGCDFWSIDAECEKRIVSFEVL